MSKIISTEKGQFYPIRTAEHLKLYASENCLTFDNGKPNATKIAEALNFSRHTISDLLSGNPKEKYKEETFCRIAKQTGIIKEYWMGITEQKNRVDYQKELFKNARVDALFLAFETKHETQYKAEIDRRTSLFASLGYNYKCPDCCRYEGFPHILTNSETSETTELDDIELDQLLQNLKDTIAFACFKKERATQQMNGGQQHED